MIAVAPSAPDDLGQGAPGRGDERHAAAHRLDRRQREALVERRHHRHLRLAVQLDDALVGDVADEPHRVAEAEPAHGHGGGAVRLRPADHDEVGVGPFGADLRQCLDEEHQPLHGHVGARRRHDPPRHGLDPVERPELGRVHAHVDDVQPGGVDAVTGHDVVEAAGRDRDDPVQAARHPGLHRGEPVEPALREPLPRRRGVLGLEPAVDGDRVVDRAEDLQARPLHLEQPVPQALVVVDDVDPVRGAGEKPGRPQGERQRLGEGGRGGDAVLEHVDPARQLRQPGHAERDRASGRGRGSGPPPGPPRRRDGGTAARSAP